MITFPNDCRVKGKPCLQIIVFDLLKRIIELGCLLLKYEVTKETDNLRIRLDKRENKQQNTEHEN